MLDFVMGDGSFTVSSGNILGPGIWLGVGTNTFITSAAPPGRQNCISYVNNPVYSAANLQTQALLGGPYSGVIAGHAQWIGTSFKAGDTLCTLWNASGQPHCSLHLNSAAQLYVTNNSGATILGPSSASVTIGVWHYFEFKAILSLSGSGTCEVRVDGAVVLTANNLTNAFGATTCNSVSFQGGNTSGAGNTCYFRDFYVVDTSVAYVILGTSSAAFTSGEIATQAGSGATAVVFSSSVGGKLLLSSVSGAPNGSGVWTGGTSGSTFTPVSGGAGAPTPSNTTYLGDVTILEVHPVGPGVNQAWSPNFGAFTVTTVAAGATANNWVFSGSWTQGGSSEFVGMMFNTSSCGTGNNQTQVMCVASAVGSITLRFVGGSAQSGLTGSAALSCPVQSGIAVNVSLPVTAVTGSGSSWTFTGSWTSGASNAYEGYYFTMNNCGSGNNVGGGGNNVGAPCTASSAGSITLAYSGGSNQSGLAGVAFLLIGTRPPVTDTIYISDANAGDISDFAMESLTTALNKTSFNGVICGVVHMSLMRKDDSGGRSVEQLCLSSGVAAPSGPESLGNSYQYYSQTVETDPATGAPWTETGLNSSTWGIEELT